MSIEQEPWRRLNAGLLGYKHWTPDGAFSPVQPTQYHATDNHLLWGLQEKSSSEASRQTEQDASGQANPLFLVRQLPSTRCLS
jgi:hypothetical protein